MTNVFLPRHFGSHNWPSIQHLHTTNNF